MTRLGDLGDDVSRIRGVSDVLATLEAEHARVNRVRLEAVRRLRTDGWSYARIGEATGLSRSRVAQLVREAAQLED